MRKLSICSLVAARSREAAFPSYVDGVEYLWAVDDDEGDRTQKVKAEANDLTKLTRIIDHQYQNSTATVSQMFTIPVALLATNP